jgi:hypothetical protein
MVHHSYAEFVCTGKVIEPSYRRTQEGTPGQALGWVMSNGATWGQAHFQHVYFLPYQGKNYGPVSQWGVKVMVLGESFYDREGQGQPPDMATRLVRDFGIGYERYAYYTRTAGVSLGRKPTDEEKRAFWHEVIFYSYIQELVGRSSRIRPAEAMWDRARLGFQEVVAEYKPQFVLVTGKELFGKLRHIGRQGPWVGLEGTQRESFSFEHSSGSALAFGIDHPSSWGWSYFDWTPWVRAALEVAKRG